MFDVTVTIAVAAGLVVLWALSTVDLQADPARTRPAGAGRVPLRRDAAARRLVGHRELVRRGRVLAVGAAVGRVRSAGGGASRRGPSDGPGAR